MLEVAKPRAAHYSNNFGMARDKSVITFTRDPQAGGLHKAPNNQIVACSNQLYRLRLARAAQLATLCDKMTRYSDGTIKALSKELCDVLIDNDVGEDVAKFLISKGIVKLNAFADLADSKSGIVEVIGRAAGLEIDDPIKCQPLKSAWRRAEAETKASLDAKAKGQDPEKDVTMGSEQRLRLDAEVKAYYKFDWPAAWLSGNQLLGKLRRMLEKRTDFVPRLEADVKTVFEKEVDPLFKIFFSKRGVLQAQADSGYTPVQGLTRFRERHFQLMIAYNQAASPDFDTVSLTVLFEYHQWLMEKILEADWAPEVVYEYLKADYRMRTKWMFSWQRKAFPTFG